MRFYYPVAGSLTIPGITTPPIGQIVDIAGPSFQLQSTLQVFRIVWAQLTLSYGDDGSGGTWQLSQGAFRLTINPAKPGAANFPIYCPGKLPAAVILDFSSGSKCYLEFEGREIRGDDFAAQGGITLFGVNAASGFSIDSAYELSVENIGNNALMTYNGGVMVEIIDLSSLT